MPTYERFCVIKQKAIPMLLCIFKCILSEGQSNAYIDSTALRVSHNKRTKSHKVFKGIAAVGKSTMGWFYGFKLHLVIDLHGNIINAKLSKGNCDDRSPVEDLLQEFQGCGRAPRKDKYRHHLRRGRIRVRTNGERGARLKN